MDVFENDRKGKEKRKRETKAPALFGNKWF